MVKKIDEDSVDVAAPQNSFQAAILPAKRFAQDSFRLVKRCTKPDAKEVSDMSRDMARRPNAQPLLLLQLRF